MIGLISESLKNMLEAQMSPSIKVALLSPADSSSQQSWINLFLYRVVSAPQPEQSRLPTLAGRAEPARVSAAGAKTVLLDDGLPSETPVERDLGLACITREFKIAGNGISKIVLNPAFVAGTDGGALKMAHLLKAARSEYARIRRLYLGGA